MSRLIILLLKSRGQCQFDLILLCPPRRLLRRCVIVPHIASATLETRGEMATRAAKNVIAGILGGEMPSRVDLSAVS
jgi:lactate dehydrogenase-like 2-hydroxyacid dehydrogenase